MKSFYILFVFFFLSTANYFAQETTIKLPTTNNSSSFNVTNSNDAVGLKLNGDAGLYLGGTYGTGTIPITGSGTRMMWYPNKAAFRVGYVDGTQWDNNNIGDYSTAMGYNTTASGAFSTTMGYNTIASGLSSTAIGYNTTASGLSSTAMGFETTASGVYCSTAMGNNTTASGNYSTAMGRNTTASGAYSTAMGYHTSTDGHEGAFVIGDYSTTTNVVADKNNQMVMRFKEGYKFYTNAVMTTGALMNQGDNSWSNISDSTKKENIIIADGEYFLTSLSKLKLGSWNYKTQDEAEFRHYGPMAQEIFHYFGKDELGVIGNDTTLASADMDGIMMICLQGLEKRTEELKTQNTEISPKDSLRRRQKSEFRSQLGRDWICGRKR
jgi:hypothetical protein